MSRFLLSRRTALPSVASLEPVSSGPCAGHTYACGVQQRSRRGIICLLRLNSELSNQSLQASAMTIELPCGLSTFGRIAGHTVHRIGDVVDAAVDLFSHRGLFFSRAGDLGVHRVDGADQRGDGIQ